MGSGEPGPCGGFRRPGRVRGAVHGGAERRVQAGGAGRLCVSRVDRRDNRGRGDLLEGAAGLAALPLGLPDVQADRVESRGDAASAAMHGLYWLTADLAERAPLLVAVDDAHWADEMSLRFVLYLARRVADMPVLVLVAARSAAARAARRSSPFTSGRFCSGPHGRVADDADAGGPQISEFWHATPAASPLPLTSATTELIAKACGPSRRSRGSGTRNRARATPAAERPQAPPSRARRRTARSRAGSAGSAASGPSAG